MKLSDQRRLATLDQYDQSELRRDHKLDGLCELVTMTLHVPIAVISFVDDKVTFQIGGYGLDIDAVPARTSFSSVVIERAAEVEIEDARMDPRFAANPLVTAPPGIRSFFGVPLVAPNGAVLGAIAALDTVPRRFTPEDSDKLAKFANAVVQILELRRLGAEARRFAVTDRLSGICDRTGLELAAEKAIAMCRRRALSFAILLIDVDGFKQVNDTLGHDAGDDLVRLIGRTLAARTRREETCARIGGDEFCVLMIGDGEFDGGPAAESVKASLEFAVRQAGYAVSFSMGLMMFARAPDDVNAALRATDALLYQAKRNGKDQIVQSRY